VQPWVCQAPQGLSCAPCTRTRTIELVRVRWVRAVGGVAHCI
jgi:hypothetical protein